MKTTKIAYGIALALMCSVTATLKAQNIYIGDINGVRGYGLNGNAINAPVSGFIEYGIAISGNDLFVVHAGSLNAPTGTIAEYTTSGTLVNASLITGLNNPSAIAISGNHLFVANYYGETVGEYGLDGSTINASLITGLHAPEGLAISGNDLFIANGGVGGNPNGAGTIGEYTTSGATINASLVTGLDIPMGLAISGNDLFVANYNGNANTIGEYTTSGATVNASLITGLDNPSGIAILGNDLFVLNDWVNGTLGEYTTSGQTINASLITGLDQPECIVIVPEPSAGALAGLGAAVLWLWRRRR